MPVSVAPAGAVAGSDSLVPPLKRWAIVGSPYRDKEWRRGKPACHGFRRERDGLSCGCLASTGRISP